MRSVYNEPKPTKCWQDRRLRLTKENANILFRNFETSRAKRKAKLDFSSTFSPFRPLPRSFPSPQFCGSLLFWKITLQIPGSLLLFSVRFRTNSSRSPLTAGKVKHSRVHRTARDIIKVISVLSRTVKVFVLNNSLGNS